MTSPRIALVGLAGLGCGGGRRARGTLLAATQDVDAWRGEGLKGGDTVRTGKPP